MKNENHMLANICKCFDGSQSYLINHCSKELWNAQLDFIIITTWSHYFISLIIWFFVSLDHVPQVFIIIGAFNRNELILISSHIITTQVLNEKIILHCSQYEIFLFLCSWLINMGKRLLCWSYFFLEVSNTSR